ncbi:MAG: LpxI family protein [Verrucomicrobiota bacterium]
MPETIHNLGIIAGSRSLPFLVAREARRSGIKRIVAAGFEGETDPALAGEVDEMVWLKVGQLSRLISTFRDRDVHHCVMAGQVAPKNLFDLRPDLRAMMLLLRLKEKNAHTIFGAIADELQKDGVTLIEATPWLTEAMPGPGFVLGPKLSRTQQDDVEFGFKIGQEIARLEIGQTVVVKDGVVLAVEGFEGTDRCIERGGELAGKKGGAIVVKVARINHDMRFDIPCIGERTIENCVKSGVDVLAIQAHKTILLEREQVEALIRRSGLTLCTVH